MITAKEAQNIQETVKGDNSRLDIISGKIKEAALIGHTFCYFSQRSPLSVYELEEIENCGFEITNKSEIDGAFYFTIKW